MSLKESIQLKSKHWLDFEIWLLITVGLKTFAEEHPFRMDIGKLLGKSDVILGGHFLYQRKKDRSLKSMHMRPG